MMRRYVYRKVWKRAAACVLDLLGAPLAWRAARASAPARPDRILVVRLDQIGDVVLTIPLLRALADRYPYAERVALVDPEVRALLEGRGLAHRVLTWASGWYRRARGPQGIWEIARVLRARHFSIALDPRGDLRVIALAALAGIPFRAGFGETGGGFLLNRCLWRRPLEHEARKGLRLLDALAGAALQEHYPEAWLRPTLAVASEDRARLAQALERGGVKLSDPYVVLHPGAQAPAKRWAIERFRQVGEALARKGFAVAVIGSADERGEQERAFAGCGFVMLSGLTDLAALAALLAGARFFLGNDSGPSHLAAAVGARVGVVASGTTHYEEWRVQSEDALIFQHAVPCSPCHLRVCPVPGHPCLAGIGAEEVVRAVSSALEVSVYGT